MQPAGIATKMSPSFKMVSKYFIATIVTFVVLNALLLANYMSITGHYFQPKILALVHIATLGWITMIIFGAMFQLVPVVLEVRLYSEKLAEVQFWVYVVGVIGLVFGFGFFKVGLHLTISAALVTIAMLMFVFNIIATMTQVTKWNFTGIHILASLVYLTLTAITGLLLSINLGYPFISRIHLDYLKIHAHLGFVGWVSMVIMGVTYKLIPMFSLSHGYSLTPSKWAFGLVNVGLLGAVVEMTLGKETALLYIYVAMLVIGILLFLFQIYLILKYRVRKVLDIGLRHSVVSFIALLLVTALGAFLAVSNVSNNTMRENLILVYGFLILFGYISMLIVGQMYKIVPFLVWFHKYSSKVGLQPVPMLKDMFSEKIASVEFWMMNVALLGAVLGLGISNSSVLAASFGLMLLVSLILSYNMFSIFRK